MPPFIVLTAQEMTAMFDLSHLACRLYIILRASMDFQTSIVGVINKISLHSLMADTEVNIPRGHGCQIIKQTLKQIRIALDSLIRNSLIVKQGDAGMIFILPMAFEAEDKAKKIRINAIESKNIV